MIEIDPLALLLFAVLAVTSLVLGLYLLFTNPPKDESKFVGFGAEKASDDELAEREARKERERESADH
jgi:hypothetical protein